MREHMQATALLLALAAVSAGRLQAAGPEPRGDTVRVGSECAGELLVVGAEVGDGEKVEPARLVTVTVGGVAKKYRRWREGDRVVEGQVVARLDDRAARAEVAVRAARVEEAKAGHEAAVRARDEAERRAWRMERSRKAAPDSVSDGELRLAQEAVVRTKAEAAGLELKARLARIRLRESEGRLKRHEVHSPTGGTVRMVLRARGEVVALGDAILEIRLAGTEGRESAWLPARGTGRLLVLGRPLPREEKVPLEGSIEVEVAALYVPARRGAAVADAVKLPGLFGWYRPWKAGDELTPGPLVVARQKLKFRPLKVGDRVREGEALALVGADTTVEALEIKLARLEGAEGEYRTAEATRRKALRLVEALDKVRRPSRHHCMSDDEFRAARLTFDRYRAEAVAKDAGVKAARAELLAALEALDRRLIRAPFAGRVTALARHRGEVVKEGEAVVQIESAPPP